MSSRQHSLPQRTSGGACEFRRKLALLAVVLVVALGCLGPVPAIAQDGGRHAQPPAAETPESPVEALEEAEAAHGGEHGASPWNLIGRIVNFALLIGIIVYFARGPLGAYVVRRRTQVREDLETADRMKREAAARMAEMEAKLEALPAELEALQARGREEIALEEQRIRELAEAERVRLLAQAERDIEQQVRLAKRELVQHAADLAVNLAERKIRTHITDADRQRLVDHYLARVQPHD